MDGDGSNIRQLTFGDIAEYDPVVLPDGRITYCRWDYVDRHDTYFQGLWTINTDGTQTAHYYGNYTRAPNVVTQAKPIPGTKKVLALAAAHHFSFLGSIIKIDVTKGADGMTPLTRMTPDVGFPETPGVGAKSGRYATPWPVNEELFFASYKEDDGQLALYLLDIWGGRELIWRAEEESCYNAMPLQPRIKPAARPDMIVGGRNKQTGVFSVANIYESRHNIKAAGKVKYLRVNQLYDQPAQIGPQPNLVANGMPVKILGEVPVNDDGSVSFEAPAKEMLQLQLLDENRMCIMNMRTFIYLQPGETSSCVGCHEDRSNAPTVSRISQIKVHKLTPPKDSNYPGGFSFQRTVQPILDKHCIRCHGLDKENKSGLSLLATPSMKKSQRHYGNKLMRVVWGVDSYFSLARYAKVANVNMQTDRSVPKDYGSHQAPLLKILNKGHHNVTLSNAEYTSLVRWLDLNCVNYGDWSWNKPEFRTPNPAGEKALRDEIRGQFGSELAEQPFEALVNGADLDQSRILMMNLPVNLGGWARGEGHWRSLTDRAYLTLKKTVERSVNPLTHKDVANTCGRGTRTGCLCGSCWVREYYSGDNDVLNISNTRRPLRPNVDTVLPDLNRGRLNRKLLEIKR